LISRLGLILSEKNPDGSEQDDKKIIKAGAAFILAKNCRPYASMFKVVVVVGCRVPVVIDVER